MNYSQSAIIVIVAATIGMFIWGRWRHDMVAAGALLACVLLGLIPGREAFSGFAHPAVITVACVLVLSQGLQRTGAIDALAQRVLPKSGGPTLSIAALAVLAAVLSAFMNNVGALALLMPLALKIADKQGLPPGKVLMPLAFASILGGTMTLIGTPSNLIVSDFRSGMDNGGFGMFDFSPVGLAVTGVGLFFVVLVGWRLVPARKRTDTGRFDTAAYLTEVRVIENSKALGKSVREVEQMLDEVDAQIVGMVRNDFRVSAPYPGRILREDDILIIEAEPESLASALSQVGLHLEENVPSIKRDDTAPEDAEQSTPGLKTDKEGGTSKETKDKARFEDLVLQELVVMPDSPLVGRSATDIALRTRYGINLLAISHQGRRSVRRLRSTAIRASDVLLIQGPLERISGFASEFECLPLVARDIRVPIKGQAVTAVSIMLLAVAATTLGLLPVAISFALSVLAFMALRIVPPRSVYSAIDWSVIVLLGALLPVAETMGDTGAADWIARFLLHNVAQGHAEFGLAVLLVSTMLMTDFMNNAATAAVMCPIAISTAKQLGVNPDTFLMAVAIGSSCAFLTPIGHQNNTLVLGPGGFRFGDYWRMGLPTDIVVIAVSIPMLLWVWPLL